MSRDKINSIEKRVVELKFIERDIMRERDVIRFPLLEKAEKSARIEELINSFFVKTMRLDRTNITVTAYPSAYSGREDDEFLSEVKVDMIYRPEHPGDYSEIDLTVYLREGFDDQHIRDAEKVMMERLLDARREVELLRTEKRALKGLHG